jgi:cytochrome c
MSTPDQRRSAADGLPMLALLLALGALAGCAVSGGTARGPAEPLGLGRPATEAEIRGWDIDIGPDGQGLPAGSGSVAAGRALYAARCAACHGDSGQGATAPRLVGGVGSLASKSPVRTVGSFWPYAPTVFDYVYRSMPFDKPMSLTAVEVYGLTAFLLHANGLLAADAVMDARSLPLVKMPNRDGFMPASAEPTIRSVRCMTDCLK